MSRGWLAVLWLAAVFVHNGCGWAAQFFAEPAEAERRLFYVGQGVLGLLFGLSLALLVPLVAGEFARWAVFALAVYVGVEQALVAACGAAWYFGTPDAEPLNRLALCDRGQGWWWLVWVSSAVVLAAAWLRRGGRKT